eukprot:TRINITY_DN14355_c0_g1_i1.p1 TRINITY_DN14355_c0_g1~~TRINITY_DN14355_c0_g1_i1.p1  ORF type:complete len:1588 (-),score=276.87 TRINITY_DN14355_c0_g1_i1:155-4918(-)
MLRVAAVAAASSSVLAQAPGGAPVDDEQFDCKLMADNWRLLWSQRKKEWCCKNSELGCEEEAYGFEVSDASLCSGTQAEYGICPNLEPCESGCKPVDCTWGSWSDWNSMGRCTGLCSRTRIVEVHSNKCGIPCEGNYAETRDCTDDKDWKACAGKEDDTVEPIPCMLSDWSKWSPCSGAAEIAGQTFRDREVLEGNNCTGALKQTKMCGEARAKDCVFTAWQDWTDCDQNCGGRQSRLRKVAHVAVHGGKPCDGVTWQNRECDKAKDCARDADCVMSDWCEWDTCSDFGQQRRSRNVKSPAIGAGKACTDTLSEIQACKDTEDVVQNCQLSEWGHWDACDRTCGGGQAYRLRHVLHGTKHCGDCPDAVTKETRPCNTQDCILHTEDMDCDMSDWGEWGECSADCGSGIKFRERKVTREASKAGKACTGNLKMVVPCHALACKKVDCQWRDWEEWSACSRSCGGGTKHRNRVVHQAPQHGGLECDAKDKTEAAACGDETCDQNGEDAAWDVWSQWSECSATCDGGYQSRSRDTSKHASTCGAPAAGESEEYRKCPGLPPCIPKQDCKLATWGEWTQCSTSCFGYRERNRVIEMFATAGGASCKEAPLKVVEQCNVLNTPECGGVDPPVDCTLAKWTEWSECPRTCGGSQHKRTRSVISQARNGGKPCDGALAETAPCSTNSCPESCRDCRWGSWTEWSGCTACGGQMTRTRAVQQVNNWCGKRCEAGDAKEITSCPRNCPGMKYCAWTEWNAFGPCEKRCGATQLRQRSLAMSEPSKSEEPPKTFLFKSTESLTCMGTQFDKLKCPGTEKECMPGCKPQNCVWGAWGKWHEPTCEGLSERSRVIATRSNDCGEPCTGPTVETKFVEGTECGPQPCLLSEWTEWSACESDTDQSHRSRGIRQYARNNGKNCEGNTLQTRACSMKVDVQDCELSPWSDWLPCTKTCGGGYRLRHREISVHAAGGGAPCADDVQELQSCAEKCCKGSTEVRDCELSAWTEWSACKDCQMSRVREMVQHAANGGKPCNGTTSETQPCQHQSDDCQLSEWENWEDCSRSCGGGQKHKHRKVIAYPSSHGKVCDDDGALMKIVPCNTQPCQAEKDCQVGDWQAWSSCDSKCGSGQHHREREIVSLPSGNGLPCNETLKEVQQCETGVPCKGLTDCSWYDWADWSVCSATCGGGHRSRTRKLELIAAIGGQPCSPESMAEVEVCDQEHCEEKCLNDHWEHWSEWGECSATCGGGVQCRTRGVELSDNPCPDQRGTHFRRECQQCSSAACDADRDCIFGDWAAWLPCTRWDDQTCTGYQERLRSYTPAKGRGAQACDGVLRERTNCTVQSEPKAGIVCHTPQEKVDCKISDWSSWGPCSGECFAGQTTRERTILVAPTNGGKACEASLSETMPCLPKEPEKNPACQTKDVDCVWGDWEEWSTCDRCGQSQSRHRSVKVYPQGNGKECNLMSTDELGGDCSAKCEDEIEHEPRMCNWQSWGEWSKCTATCGAGHRERRRDLAVTQEKVMPEELNNEVITKDYDAEILRHENEVLETQARQTQAARAQELFLAFAAGMMTLMVLFVCGRTLRGRGDMLHRDALESASA